jgi:excisionase family DNA binding protein
MTYQTSPGQTGHAGAVAASICHRLFSIEQAADFAGVPVQVIRCWIRMGKLEAYRLGGRVRVDEIELVDLLPSPEARQP